MDKSDKGAVQKHLAFLPKIFPALCVLAFGIGNQSRDKL
jgi:hypothetical protein